MIIGAFIQSDACGYTGGSHIPGDADRSQFLMLWEQMEKSPAPD